MRRFLFLCFVLMLFSGRVSAQKTKSWTEWNSKEVQKMLSDSAWAQTQTELNDAPSSASSSAITKTESRNAATMVMGDAAKNQETGENVGKQSSSLSLTYRVSFLSARPIRQALIRMIELQKPDLPPEKVTELRTFVDRDFGDYIVVTLIVDGTDKKRIALATQEITGANFDALKAATYLERKDGKRTLLMDYRPPSTDGMGAKFVFPRTVDGKPFLDATSGEVKFSTEIGKAVRVNRRFKISEMTYEGKLEY